MTTEPSTEDALIEGTGPKIQVKEQEPTVKKKSLVLNLFSGKRKIKINLTLVPLKIALVIMYGGGVSATTFLHLLLKQKGLTIGDISFIYLFNPFFHFTGPLISGIIADKIGRAKPVLLGNLFLTTIVLNCIMLTPSVQRLDCSKPSVTVKCHPEELHLIETFHFCNFSGFQKCEAQCPNAINDTLCGNFNKTMCVPKTSITFTFLDNKIVTYKNESLNRTDLLNLACSGKITWLSQNMLNFCSDKNHQTCNITCYSSLENIFCDDAPHADNKALVFAMSFVFLIMFRTAVTSAFRMIDVTVMYMVETHDSDFGWERAWGVFGILIFSLVSGYLVEATTHQTNRKNYDAVVYLFNALYFTLMLIVWKLDVQIQAPGKQMLKKSFQLLRNPDILAFSLAILILGTCWCFSKQYNGIYLDSIGAPSSLIGLNSSLHSLFGLPFLLTSNFWIKKIGMLNLLILGFAGYTISYVGYVYLTDPWWSLPLESTGILTYHLLWVTVMCYSHKVAPEGLSATVMSTAGAIHFSIGRGTGSALGGMTMSKFGGRTAYKVMATTSGVSGILYAIFLFMRRSSKIKTFSISM